MSLKTNYKNDKFSGKRKYKVTTLPTGEINLDDTTIYVETGDIFTAEDINATNGAVEAANRKIEETNNAVGAIDNRLTLEIGKMRTLRIVNAPVSGWSGAAPFVQSVAVAGITALSAPVTGMQYPAGIDDNKKTLIDKSFGMITEIETLAGVVKITCRFKKPVADLILCLKGE